MINITPNLDTDTVVSNSYIVGLSGGVDSVVLLRSVKEQYPNVNLVACHLNHGLRIESDEDEDFCRTLCDDLQVTFVSEKFNQGEIKDYCRQNKYSIEEGARKIRHEFFKNIAAQNDAVAILLGHHQNDRVETVFYNFLRGSGVHGLAAMRGSFDKIRRPLINYTKEEIIEYANYRSWSWVEDTSNQSSDYDRNWLRNEILPSIAERFPGAINVVSRSAENFEQVSDYMKQQAREFIDNRVSVNEYELSKSTFFNLQDLSAAHPALKNEIIHELFILTHDSGYGFSSKVIKEFEKWLNQKNLSNGVSIDFGKIRLVNRNGYLGIAKGNSEIAKELFSKYSLTEELHVATPKPF